MCVAQVVSLLQEGGQLSQPAHCPGDVYTLMTWCWQRRPLDRPAFTAIHDALVDLRAGRVANLPILPTPAHLASSPHHLHHHHDPYTPYESHTLPHAGHMTGTCGSGVAHPSTTLPHFHHSSSGSGGGGGAASVVTTPHSCLASMRAGSRGSFCSTDLLTPASRPCSCVPHQQPTPSLHMLTTAGPPVTTTTCHTLPRNNGSSTAGVTSISSSQHGSPKHSHRLSQSGSHHHNHPPPASHHHHMHHHTTLPRMGQQQSYQLPQQQQQQHSCHQDQPTRKEDELREVPEEPLSTSSTGPQPDSSIASASSPPSVTSESMTPEVTRHQEKVSSPAKGALTEASQPLALRNERESSLFTSETNTKIEDKK